MTGAPDGGRNGFAKLDLHVHTPISACYGDYMRPDDGGPTSPEDIVRAALVAGLDGIAVTDHNGVAAIDKMRAAASGSGLLIYPGVELSTRGGHLLALFDPSTTVPAIRALVREAGFREEDEGQGHIQSPLWLDEAAELIVLHGGLAIAAHVDRWPRGLAASDEELRDRKRLHASPHITALEITSPLDKERWTSGAVPYYPKAYPCIQSSDAHATYEMARRPFYAALQTPDLQGLRQALGGHETSIRFPHEMEAAASLPS